MTTAGGGAQTLRVIRSPVGPLEAVLRRPAGPPAGALVVCHPHPLYGGTLHNRVVFRLARAAGQARWAALRFNFRGVGRSAGQHASGVGEPEDVLAALDHLAAECPGAPLAVAGYSFGAWVGLRAGSRDARVRGLVAAGLPVRLHDLAELRGCSLPKLFVQGEEDEFGPAEELRRFAEALPGPCRVVVLPGDGHFIDAGLPALEAETRGFLAGLAGRGR